MELGSDTVFDFVETVDSLPSIDSILHAMQTHLQPFGLEHFIFTGLPTRDESIGALVKTNCFPDQWWSRYVNNDYDQKDRVCQHAMRTANPFFWHDAPSYGDGPEAEIVMGEAAEFGLRDGYLVPLYSPHHWQSVLSMSSSERLDFSMQEQGAINLIAIYAAAAIEKHLRNPKSDIALTRREREVLECFIMGKTGWETSCILSVSERTVRFHIRHILEKFDAANMTHAVAKAVAKGIIPKNNLSELTG